MGIPDKRTSACKRIICFQTYLKHILLECDVHVIFVYSNNNLILNFKKSLYDILLLNYLLLLIMTLKLHRRRWWEIAFLFPLVTTHKGSI